MLERLRLAWKLAAEIQDINESKFPVMVFTEQQRRDLSSYGVNPAAIIVLSADEIEPFARLVKAIEMDPSSKESLSLFRHLTRARG